MYLGVRLWRSPAVPIVPGLAAPTGFGRRFLEGLSLQLTNPKAIFFFLSVFPQFLDHTRPMAPQFAVLVLTYSTLVVLIHSGYALSAQRARSWLGSERGGRTMNRVGGATFVFFGAALATAKTVGRYRPTRPTAPPSGHTHSVRCTRTVTPGPGEDAEVVVEVLGRGRRIGRVVDDHLRARVVGVDVEQVAHPHGELDQIELIRHLRVRQALPAVVVSAQVAEAGLRRAEPAEVGEPTQAGEAAEGEVRLQGATPVGALVLDADGRYRIEEPRLAGAGVDQHLRERIDVEDPVLGPVEPGRKIEGAVAAGGNPIAGRDVDALGAGVETVGEVLDPADIPEPGPGENVFLVASSSKVAPSRIWSLMRMWK